MLKIHTILKRNNIQLQLCFFVTVIGSIIRKFVPGQPNFIEPLLNVMVISCVFLISMEYKPWKTWPFPVWLRQPVFIWLLFLLIYLIPGFFVSLPMVGMVIAIRCIPIAIMVVAYRSIRTNDDFKAIVLPLGYLVLLFLPLGCIVSFFGNEALPFYLRPIEKLTALGKDQKGGFDTLALIYNAEQTFAFSVLTIEYLCLAVMHYEKKRILLYWSFIGACIVLLFISTQRGAFYAGLIGLFVHLIIQKGTKKKGTIAIFTLITIGVLAVDKISAPETKYSHYDNRAALMTNIDVENRINVIFLGIGSYWLKRNPFGTYIGFAGPEGKILGGEGAAADSTVETGYAQLIAEMGVIGALLMPAIVIFIVVTMIKKTNTMQCRQSVILLSTFMCSFFILFYMKAGILMTTMTMGQMGFWAAPGIGAALIKIEQKNRAQLYKN
jgi:hypothetical protein